MSPRIQRNLVAVTTTSTIVDRILTLVGEGTAQREVVDYVDRFVTNTSYQEQISYVDEPDPEVSNLAGEVFQDATSNNCVDYTCELLEKLTLAGEDLSDYEVVFFASTEDGEPGHVGLLRRSDNMFFDSSGEHNFAEWEDANPDLVQVAAPIVTGARFLEIMTLPPGDARNAALAGAGLGGLAGVDLAQMPPVFDTQEELDAAILRGDSLVGATFNFQVEGTNFDDLDLTDAHFVEGVRDVTFNDATLVNVVFDGPVEGYNEFFSADLQGAVFNGPLSGSSFLYADLRGANFEAADSIERTTFSFTITDTETRIPYGLPTVAYAGLPGGPEMLQHVQVNTPEILLSVTGTDDPVEQQRIVREMAANGTLFAALEPLLPLDGVLPPSWRSLVREGMVDFDIHQFPVKSYVFDGVDEHWTPNYNLTRPAEEPTLTWLYYDLPSVEVLPPDPGPMPSLQPVIDDILADMLLSEEPIYLDSPIGDRVSYGQFWSAFPVDGFTSAADYAVAARASIGVVDWDWNGSLRDRGDIAVPAPLIDYALATLPAAEAERLRAIGADHIVSVADLERAGLLDAVFAGAYEILT